MSNGKWTPPEVEQKETWAPPEVTGDNTPITPKSEPLVQNQPAVTQGRQFAQPSTSNLAGSTSPLTDGQSVSGDLTQRVQKIVQDIPEQKENSWAERVKATIEQKAMQELTPLEKKTEAIVGETLLNTQINPVEKQIAFGNRNPLYELQGNTSLANDQSTFVDAQGSDYWLSRQASKGGQPYNYETDNVLAVVGSGRPISMPADMRKVMDDYLKHLSINDPNQLEAIRTAKDYQGLEVKEGSDERNRRTYYIELDGGSKRVPEELNQFVRNGKISQFDDADKFRIVNGALQHQQNILWADYKKKINSGEPKEKAYNDFVNASKALSDIQERVINDNKDFSTIVQREQEKIKTAEARQKMADLEYETYYEKNPLMASIYYGFGQPVKESVKGALKDIYSTPYNLGISDLAPLAAFANEEASPDITPTKLQGDLWDKDGFHFEKTMNRVSRTGADMVTLIAGSKGLGTLTRIGYKPALFGTSYAMTYNDYYDEARNAGLTPDQADSHAQRSAFLTSLLEMVSPNINLTQGLKSQLTEQTVKNLSKGMTMKDSFKEALKVYSKEIPQENVQEILQLIGDKYQASVTNEMNGREAIDTKITGTEIGETVFLTSVVTGLGNMGALKSPNTLQKSAIYNSIQNYDDAIGLIEKGVKDGNITSEQAKVTVDGLNEAKQIVDGLPQDLKLNSKQKMDLADIIYQKKRLAEQVKNEYVDESFKTEKEAEISKKKAALDKQIQDVVNRYEDQVQMQQEPGGKPEIIKPETKDEKAKETQEAEVLTPEVKPEREGIVTPGEEIKVESKIKEDAEKNGKETPATSEETGAVTEKDRGLRLRDDAKIRMEAGEKVEPELQEISGIDNKPIEWKKEGDTWKFKSVAGNWENGSKSDQARLNKRYEDLTVDKKSEPKKEQRYEPLTEEEQEINDRFQKDLEENYEERKAQYLKEHGTVFDTDRARSLSPDYNESPALTSGATQVPAREFVNKIYQEELKKQAPEGKSNTVMFMSGGPGVGKTKGTQREVQEEDPHIVVDSNLANFDRAVKDIDEALNAGKDVKIIFTYRNPVKAFTDKAGSIMTRSTKIGRTVPADVSVEINRKSLETIKKLADHYSGNERVNIDYFNNDGKIGDAKQITLDDVKGIKVDWEQAKKDIHNELDKQYNEGGLQPIEGAKFTREDIYAGLKGDVKTTKRSLSEVVKKNRGKVSTSTKQSIEGGREGVLKETEKKVSKEKEAALSELEKAREAFRKKMGGLTTGGPFQAIPELINLIAAYGKVGYVTVKDVIKQFRSDFPESKITDEDIEKHFEEAGKEKPVEKLKEEPKEKERKFAKRVSEGKEVRSEVKEKLKDKTYTEIPNDITLTEADSFIKEHGIEAAENAVYNTANGMSPRVRIMMGQAVVKQLDSQAVKEKDPVAKNELFNRAASLADELARIGTEYGQGIQAFSVWNNLSVDGMLNIFKRTNKNAKKLISEQTKNTKKKIKEAVDAGVNRAAKKVAESIKSDPPKGLKKTKAFGLTAEQIAEGKKKALEKIKAARSNLTAGGLSKEFIEGALEYGYFVFAEGVRTFKEWVKSMKEAGITEDNDLLNDLWNNHPVAHGKTLAQLAKVGDLQDIVAENYKSGGNVDTLTEAISEYFGIPEEDAKSISKEIDKRFKEIRNKEVKKAIKEKVSPGSREAKKAIKEISENPEINSKEEIEKTFEKEFGIDEETDPKLREKLLELDEKRKAAPEGFLKNNITVDMLSEISKAKGGRGGSIFWSLWYASILSGPETQVLNFVSNATNLGLESAVSAIEQALVKKDIKSFAKAMGYMVSNLGRGLTEVEAVMKEGPTALAREATKLEAKDSIEDFDFKGGNKNLANWYKDFLKYVSLRPLASVDTLFYTAANSLASYKAAVQTAKDEGLEGEELKDRVDQILGNTKQQYEEARQQAIEEVDNFYDSTGKDKNTRKYHRDIARRIYEIVINNQPEDVKEKGESFGKFVTYNYTPKGYIGSVANALANLGQAVPPFRMIVPFTRIVANVLNQQLDWTPYGYARAFGVNASSWTHGDKTTGYKGDAEGRNRELIKATIGTALMVGIYALAKSYEDDEDPYFEVNGKGPSDFNKKNQLHEQGWKPYTIKIGDKYLSYQYSPLAVGLSFIGNWRDNEKYNDLSEKDFMTKAGFALKSTSSGIMDMSFLTGLSGFMDALSSSGDPEASAEKFLKSAGRTATSFIPNFFKQMDNIYFDNTVYDTKTIKGAILADIPFVRTYVGAKPKLNVLGENIEKHDNIMRRFFSTKNPDEIWTTLADKKLWIPGAQPGTKKINGESMTDDEFYDYVKISGGYMRDWLEKNIDKIKDMDTETAQKVITKVMGVQRKRAKVEISLRGNEEIKPEDVKITE